MVAELELYPSVEALFKDEYLMDKEVELGSKRIDLVCVHKTTGKVIAIEFKVKNWKKALRQAWTYKACANESYIALPENRVSLVEPELLSNLGLGMISIPSKGTAKVVFAAPSADSISQNSNLLIKANIISQSQEKPSVNRANKPFEYYLWYNAQDTQFFQQFSDVYTGFIVNAHTLAHFQSAFSALCLSLNKPFFVIPDTHFFQHARLGYFYDSKGELRTSWKKLLDEYGGVTKEAITEDRNLTPQDFDVSTRQGLSNLKSLSERVISHQKSKFNQGIAGLSFFSDIEEEEAPKQNLVTPYFHFNSEDDPWYTINLQAVKESIALKGDSDLFALLCVEKDALIRSSFIERVRADYSTLDITGFIIWIANFEETKDSLVILKGLRDFAAMLSSEGKKVINLFGGYYSILLRHFGLTGLASGICTRDSGDPTNFPTGGPPGGPNPRYYFPDFKVKMDRAESSVILSTNPQITCPCDICKLQLKQMIDPATPKPVARQLMRQHFLYCRNMELEKAEKSTLEQDITELKVTFERFRNKSTTHIYTLPPIDQLPRWFISLQR